MGAMLPLTRNSRKSGLLVPTPLNSCGYQRRCLLLFQVSPLANVSRRICEECLMTSASLAFVVIVVAVAGVE
jgi:hypothetical protein